MKVWQQTFKQDDLDGLVHRGRDPVIRLRDHHQHRQAHHPPHPNQRSLS
jgi:hypothetical protein